MRHCGYLFRPIWRPSAAATLALGTNMTETGGPLAGSFEAERGAPSSAPASEPEPTGVVLYIEDSPVNLLIVESLLQDWPGVTLLQAETGLAGIALAQAATPALILLDMGLPDMKGLAVLELLQSSDKTRGCTVVALSASAVPDEVAAVRNAGAVDYWTKPIDFHQFQTGVRALLREGR